MINISKKNKDFIEKNILSNLGYADITDDNIENIVNYIIDNYEVPLAQAKEAGDDIDESLLKAATDVVTEITSNPEW